MKKRKLITSLLLGVISLCSAGFISCSNHTHDYQKTINGSTFTMSCECGEISKGYRVQFIYAKDGSPADEGIEVSWTDKSGKKVTKQTNGEGYVESLQLKDDSYIFSVNEDTLPVINGEQYLYNSNTFSQQENGVGFIIPLFAVEQPTETNTISVQDLSDSEISHTYDCYSINLNAVYFAEIKNATQTLFFNLQNVGYGKYTVDATMAGDISVELDRYFGYVHYVNPSPDSKTDKTQPNKLTYTVVNTDAEQNSMFCIKVPNATSYPVTVPIVVSITYVPEDVSVESETFIRPTHFQTEETSYKYYITATDGSDKPIETSTLSLVPVAGVEKCADVEGSVVNDLTQTEYESIQLRSDKYYYTSSNQLVYVKLTTQSIFENLTLASYLIDSNPPSFAIYKVTEQNDYGFYTRRDNYFGFVQAYASLANSDGLYPLTDEMHDYLKIVEKKEHRGVYEMLCTYPTKTNNFAQGDGSQNNPYTVSLGEQTLGNYKISIPAGGKIYVELNGTMDITLTYNSNVTATIDPAPDDDTECIQVAGKTTVLFETKNGNAQDFILKIAKYDNIYELEVGNNQIYALADNTQVHYDFVVPESGTYDISVPTANVTVYTTYEGTRYEINGSTLSLSLKKGELVTFTAESLLSSTVNFTLTIEQPTEE